MKKAIAVTILLAMAGLTVLWAQQAVPKTQADITGTGATVVINPSSATVRWIQMVAPSTNGSNVRWGDASTSSTQGAIIAPGGGQYLQQQGGPYVLKDWSVFVANGDKLTVTWGQ